MGALAGRHPSAWLGASSRFAPSPRLASRPLHATDRSGGLLSQTNPERVKQAIDAGKIKLSPEELDEIRQAIDSVEVKGVRYAKNPHMQAMLFG